MTKDEHRSLAVKAFNGTWDLIDKKNKSKREVLEMIHMAHTSRHHWKEAGGTELNLARGEWQISHVYSLAGLGESALFHAEAYFDSVKENDFRDFDLVFAYEALAYAHKVLGNEELKEKYLKEGYANIDQCEKQGDKDYCKSQLDLI